MAIYTLLDVYLLCDNPFVGRCLGDDNAMSKLEDLLGSSAHLLCNRKHRGSSDWEYCGFNVSISSEL